VMRGLSNIADDETREAALQKTRVKVPLRQQHGDPFDVANAALFLASDEAKHLTGVILNVDGGLECAPI
jgi:NAD(P)-dependent dehydrogenase (short-subunit alcohol dehydrogenase family)